jgi:hypothetical protein
MRRARLAASAQPARRDRARRPRARQPLAAAPCAHPQAPWRGGRQPRELPGVAAGSPASSAHLGKLRSRTAQTPATPPSVRSPLGAEAPTLRSQPSLPAMAFCSSQAPAGARSPQGAVEHSPCGAASSSAQAKRTPGEPPFPGGQQPLPLRAPAPGQPAWLACAATRCVPPGVPCVARPASAANVVAARRGSPARIPRRRVPARARSLRGGTAQPRHRRARRRPRYLCLR